MTLAVKTWNEVLQKLQCSTAIAIEENEGSFVARFQVKLHPMWRPLLKEPSPNDTLPEVWSSLGHKSKAAAKQALILGLLSCFPKPFPFLTLKRLVVFIESTFPLHHFTTHLRPLSLDMRRRHIIHDHGSQGSLAVRLTVTHVMLLYRALVQNVVEGRKLEVKSLLFQLITKLWLKREWTQLDPSLAPICAAAETMLSDVRLRLLNRETASREGKRKFSEMDGESLRFRVPSRIEMFKTNQSCHWCYLHPSTKQSVATIDITPKPFGPLVGAQYPDSNTACALEVCVTTVAQKDIAEVLHSLGLAVLLNLLFSKEAQKHWTMGTQELDNALKDPGIVLNRAVFPGGDMGEATRMLTVRPVAQAQTLHLLQRQDGNPKSVQKEWKPQRTNSMSEGSSHSMTRSHTQPATKEDGDVKETKPCLTHSMSESSSNSMTQPSMGMSSFGYSQMEDIKPEVKVDVQSKERHFKHHPHILTNKEDSAQRPQHSQMPQSFTNPQQSTHLQPTAQMLQHFAHLHPPTHLQQSTHLQRTAQPAAGAAALTPNTASSTLPIQRVMAQSLPPMGHSHLHSVTQHSDFLHTQNTHSGTTQDAHIGHTHPTDHSAAEDTYIQETLAELKQVRNARSFFNDVGQILKTPASEDRPLKRIKADSVICLTANHLTWPDLGLAQPLCDASPLSMMNHIWKLPTQVIDQLGTPQATGEKQAALLEHALLRLLYVLCAAGETTTPIQLSASHPYNPGDTIRSKESEEICALTLIMMVHLATVVRLKICAALSVLQTPTTSEWGRLGTFKDHLKRNAAGNLESTAARIDAVLRGSSSPNLETTPASFPKMISQWRLITRAALLALFPMHFAPNSSLEAREAMQSQLKMPPVQTPPTDAENDVKNILAEVKRIVGDVEPDTWESVHSLLSVFLVWVVGNDVWRPLYALRVRLGQLASSLSEGQQKFTRYEPFISPPVRGPRRLTPPPRRKTPPSNHLSPAPAKAQTPPLTMQWVPATVSPDYECIHYPD
eukprot:Blabericola_migrator_1__9953@NODE_54_length_16124_cov_113_894563_g50_i0_p2_GENE_NODE_54_length_16124_cov_113_894563_g50_i0NODE_54_length_16124_cov_113_894563_g50_i0_p2_ORF_typecomplete_len1007_score195_58YkyB/PF14177_6/0_023Imm8/PF15586_6/1e04Imm8/PF15586_6/0_63_NODE_54_length_16124_cov_113_894563_g50_i061009120